MNTIHIRIFGLIIFILLKYNTVHAQYDDNNDNCTPTTSVEWICNFENPLCNNSSCVEAEGSLPDLTYIEEGSDGVIRGTNPTGCFNVPTSIGGEGDTLFAITALTYDLHEMDLFLKGACFLCGSTPIDCEERFGIPDIEEIITDICEGRNDSMPGLQSIEEVLDLMKEISISFDIEGIHKALQSLNAVGILDPICYATTERTYLMALLPVELQSFEGIGHGCNIQLKWETDSEHNFSHFEIERSYNGIDFDVMGRLQSTGNNDDITGSTYTYTDKVPNLVNYYRLKMIDMDNTFNYSDVITVKSECTNGGSGIDIYPNPVKGSNFFVKINSTLNTNNVNVYVINQLGSIVSEEVISITEGPNTIKVNTDKLNVHTIYFLKIESDKWKTKTAKFIKYGE